MIGGSVVTLPRPKMILAPSKEKETPSSRQVSRDQKHDHGRYPRIDLVGKSGKRKADAQV
jgi:hypothetical protein